MTFLVADAALHRDGAEHLGHRGPERLGSVQDHQHPLLDIQASVDEVSEQVHGDGLVLRRAVPQPERHLDPVGRDPQANHAAAALQLDRVEHQHREADVLKRP